MPENPRVDQEQLPPGVMFNAYPDSIGSCLAGALELLKKPELDKAFSLFYILPTFFNSDLDRGFSIIDYNLNRNLVAPADLQNLQAMKVKLKLDLVLNHLSINSPQFQDLLQKGRDSEYSYFFIDWNKFWNGRGQKDGDGCIIPDPEYLEKLFMRKPGLPVMKVRFPDGTKRFYWNTFYREISYSKIKPADFLNRENLPTSEYEEIAGLVNRNLDEGVAPEQIDFGPYSPFREQILATIEKKASYRGQLDLNARSDKVWDFYDQTLNKLSRCGARIVRLDAFAYLHKEPGRQNFFNRPETWEYLERLTRMAQNCNLVIFPEIHAEYGSALHEEIAGKGYPFYDFFFPGLIIDALDRGTSRPLLKWIDEITVKGYQTINMLGCHDGIPVLDLKGKKVNGSYRPGLLSDEEIDAVVERIIKRGGRIKSLYGSDGKKISYYQVNATFFSALGEDERKLSLARAVQLFMPGTPQIWYLDLFAGKNNYETADRGGPAGHKEINRTNLSIKEAEKGLQLPVVREQLEMIRLRNTSPAFKGPVEFEQNCEPHLLKLGRKHKGCSAALTANLRDHTFRIEHVDQRGKKEILPHP